MIKSYYHKMTQFLSLHFYYSQLATWRVVSKIILFYVFLTFLSYNGGKLIIVLKKIDVKGDQNKN